MKTQIKKLFRNDQTRKNLQGRNSELTKPKPCLAEMSAEEQAIGQALSSFVITTIITL
ncbi:MULTISPECIES: translation initiation factor IF-2 [Erysipelothrix]|uniref:translation initiation factor IF-2 n=1 Tax=Erysipelothrix TaxID=1647 RepID=UPI001377E212|nr:MULTISPECIES: translation initiation factor IF-2 [unclassified Erysipelothrix]MBK2402815.1 translation initiation factor IF-2 [Erysipelothrix sp. strain 2 (EsS2-6-Brazil)]MBK2404094.1 translation initiation factor IF-2 [Erysipelothrix sp. strain 2 (EsS2-7-Brazil)]NBA01691.1 translation initiation factor IF-2 [Erysipelothrix rhusiopathiae]